MSVNLQLMKSDVMCSPSGDKPENSQYLKKFSSQSTVLKFSELIISACIAYAQR